MYHVAGQAHASSITLLPVLELMRAYFAINELDSARPRASGSLASCCCSTRASTTTCR